MIFQIYFRIHEVMMILQVLYQAGVFISRSSVNTVLLPYWALVLLPILQVNSIIKCIIFSLCAIVILNSIL